MKMSRNWASRLDFRFVVSAAQYFFPILRVQALESTVWPLVIHLVRRYGPPSLGASFRADVKQLLVSWSRIISEVRPTNSRWVTVFVPTLHIAEFVTSFS